MASWIGRGYLIAALSLTPLASALAQEVDWRHNRLLSLEKITVGPADNYQSQLDGQRLFFTRHANLLPQLMEQQRADGRLRQLLPDEYDSKDPALSPDGRWLALTSFRRSALGDICLIDPNRPRSSFRCLTSADQRQRHPFWLDANTLGFVQTQGDQQQIWAYHLPSDQQELLLAGQFAAVNASPDGRYLIYQQRSASPARSTSTENAAGLFLYDRQQQREYGPLQLDLPGLTGYMLMDADQQWLYFSHYLNDTSGDQQIDAEDHSVIFRLPVSAFWSNSTQRWHPEQLTSVAQNCNFPSLADTWLYVTCAFEGSLDIYRLPISGLVPTHWGRAELEQAHQQASRYEDRLLLLNRLRALASTAEAPWLLERQLSNHLALDEFTAADYYLAQLQSLSQQQHPANEVQFFGQLRDWLALQAEARQQPQGQLSAQFRRRLREAEARLQADQPDQAFFAAGISLLRGDRATSLTQLHNWGLDQAQHPLQVYLALEWVQRLQVEPDEQLAWLIAAARHPLIDEQAQLFYTYQALRHLQASAARRGETQALAPLIALEAELTHPQLQALVANEQDLLRLIQSDVSEQRVIYRRISQRLAAWQHQPAWRRAGHLRAIQRMGLAQEYDLMELMSRHWLTQTQLDDVGFAATADQYALINLERGYAAWQAGHSAAALNTFYAVSRQTNDLEALYNLVNLGEQVPALNARLELLLNQLEAEQLIGHHLVFVEALRRLNQLPPLAELNEAQAREARRTLEAVITQLSDFRAQGRDQGVADLLLASSYQRLLLLNQQGYRFDRDLFQLAHYHSMLALDLAWQHPRLEAALLNNLGQLHMSVRNYGLAADFFAQRAQLPFLLPEDEIWLRWRLARAYFYTNRFQAAANEAEQAYQLAQTLLPAAEQRPLQERAAFYQLQAHNWDAATPAYRELLQAADLPAELQAQAWVNLGYSQFKQGEGAAAQRSLLTALDHLAKLPPRAPVAGQLAGFEPLRLTWQVYGLLAQTPASPEQRQAWLEARLAALQQAPQLDFAGLDARGQLEMQVFTRVQLLVLQADQADADGVQRRLNEIHSDLGRWLSSGAPAGSPVMLNSLHQALSLLSLAPDLTHQHLAPFASLVEQVIEQLTLTPVTPSVQVAQQARLRLLLDLARQRQGLMSLEELEAAYQAQRHQPSWQQLQNERPDLAAELSARQQGLLAWAQGQSR
ncbi:hypothetical protein V6U78_06980 [Marinospirillum sp. MEB164]|uniref:Tetratricopeptide repeat-containing protein n=1 Tax=Marinospirillum alkalitolerans TaxID=3123374 RepID=A0ABW8PWY7_9GAMM